MGGLLGLRGGRPVVLPAPGERGPSPIKAFSSSLDEQSMLPMIVGFIEYQQKLAIIQVEIRT